jgi:hypothetical protein
VPKGLPSAFLPPHRCIHVTGFHRREQSEPPPPGIFLLAQRLKIDISQRSEPLAKLVLAFAHQQN